MLRGMQELEILLDRRSFRRGLGQLVIGHPESRRRVHVVHIFVVDERSRLADQRVDHVAKVDGFLLTAELSRHPLKAFVSIPEFKVVLMNAYFDLQADVLALDRIGVSLHADDAVRLHGHNDRSAGTATLCWQRAEGRDFFTKPFCSLIVATAN